MSTPLVANVTGLMPVQIDGFPVDASLSESHDYDDEVTQFPVEKGSDITDNKRKRPLKVTIEGLVTDTPLGQFARHSTRQSGLPTDTARAKLLAVRDADEPIIIVTSLDLYKNMLLTSLSFPREGGEPHQLHFKVEFVQVTFITNNRTTVRTATPGGKPKDPFGALLAKLGKFQTSGGIPVFSVPKSQWSKWNWGDPYGKPLKTEENGTRRYTPTDDSPVADGFLDVGNVYHPYAQFYVVMNQHVKDRTHNGKDGNPITFSPGASLLQTPDNNGWVDMTSGLQNF